MTTERLLFLIKVVPVIVVVEPWDGSRIFLLEGALYFDVLKWWQGVLRQSKKYWVYWSRLRSYSYTNNFLTVYPIIKCLVPLESSWSQLSDSEIYFPIRGGARRGRPFIDPPLSYIKRFSCENTDRGIPPQTGLFLSRELKMVRAVRGGPFSRWKIINPH